VLKKYANRRLYDTGIKRYTTVSEISERVLNGESVPAHNGGDATSEVLLSIIAMDKPTPGELRAAIRMYRSVRQGKRVGDRK
jgi:polyhydroxyalkanoate synthesis regulator protein